MSIQLVPAATGRAVSPLPAPDRAAEAHHRIANSLTLITSLVRLQVTGIADYPGTMDGDEVRLILQEFGGRVETIGRLHGLLAIAAPGAAIDVAAYLQDVAEAVVAGLSSPGDVELLCDCGADCFLPPETALSLGLIVGELTTNAVKYAHPTGVAGKIRVDCHKNAAGMIVIEVTDDGVGLPEGFDFETDGQLGFRLVRSLADQLAVTRAYTSSALGLSVVLQIPAHPAAKYTQEG